MGGILNVIKNHRVCFCRFMPPLYRPVVLDMNRTAEKIAGLSTIVDPQRKFSLVAVDRDDNTFLDCAFEAKADFIVRQDKHLLNLKEFEGIKIITPAEFLRQKQE